MPELDYIAVDLETTGLDPKTERITEIGALRVIGGEIAAEYHTMVNPHRQLEERIIELTGITQEEVDAAPDLDTVLPEFLDFCGDLPLLGHHVIFDYSFLKRAAVNRKLEFERNGIDTLKLCQSFMPGEAKKNLAAACVFFGIERGQAHRALSDAMDTHRLYAEIMRLHAGERPEAFAAKPLIYKVKREQPASKKQKEDLRNLLRYHKIDSPVQIDDLTRNEVSRLKDQLIFRYGRVPLSAKG